MHTYIRATRTYVHTNICMQTCILTIYVGMHARTCITAIHSIYMHIHEMHACKCARSTSKNHITRARAHTHMHTHTHTHTHMHTLVAHTCIMYIASTFKHVDALCLVPSSAWIMQVPSEETAALGEKSMRIRLYPDVLLHV